MRNFLGAVPDARLVTPETLDAALSQIQNMRELQAFLEALSAVENATTSARQRDMYSSMRAHATQLFAQWQNNQVAFASKYEAERGWHFNPDLVPAANYMGRSADPSEYARAIIAMYGGLSNQDAINRTRVKEALDAAAAEEAAARAKQEAAQRAAAAAAAASAAAAKVAAAAAAVQNNPTPQNVQTLNTAQQVSANADADHADATQQVADAGGAGASASAGAGIVKLLGLGLTLWSVFK